MSPLVSAANWIPCDRAGLPAPPARGRLQLWLMNLDDPPWPSATLWEVLDASERERAARFHFERHRSRFAHGRGLLRHLLAHATGGDPAGLRLVAGPQGKPRLAGKTHEPPPTPLVDFNLSHSDAWALLGLSDGSAVGVDIEVPRPVPELREIAERNFAPSERAALLALPERRQAEAFLACWTRKEAFVKALGGGLSVALDSFEVSLRPDEPARLLRSADAAHPVEHFTLWAGTTPQQHHCAAVVRRAGTSVQTFSLR